MTTLIAILVIGLLAALFGGLLGFASVKFKVDGDPLVDQSRVPRHAAPRLIERRSGRPPY